MLTLCSFVAHQQSCGQLCRLNITDIQLITRALAQFFFEEEEEVEEEEFEYNSVLYSRFNKEDRQRSGVVHPRVALRL